MPKVFEKDGYKFFFYSNEHRPIHVHVRRGDGEAVFNVEESVRASRVPEYEGQRAIKGTTAC